MCNISHEKTANKTLKQFQEIDWKKHVWSYVDLEHVRLLCVICYNRKWKLLAWKLQTSISIFKFLALQTVLAAKEIELEQYKSLVEELNQQINGLQMDTDKTSLAMLQQVRNSDLCKAMLTE